MPTVSPVIQRIQQIRLSLKFENGLIVVQFGARFMRFSTSDLVWGSLAHFFDSAGAGDCSEASPILVRFLETSPAVKRGSEMGVPAESVHPPSTDRARY